MPITGIDKAAVGLYSIPLSKPTPEIIFHWKIDCSRLRDPIGQSTLRALDGRDAKVQAFLMEDPRVKGILHAIRMIAAEKAKWTSIALFDYHGRYISTAMVELAARELDVDGVNVLLSHHALGPGSK